MIKKIKSLLYNLFLLFPYSFGQRKKYYKGDEKNSILKFIDLSLWLLRDNQFNHHYYAFGLNIKKSNQNVYIGRKEFLLLKQKAENMLKSAGGFDDIEYAVLTKDKFVANAFFLANCIPCVPVLGLITSDEILYTDGRIEPLDELIRFDEPFVLKNVILEYGEGFMLCTSEGGKISTDGVALSLHELRERVGNGKWVIQKRIKSHEAIRKLNATALNTTRIVTILNGKYPVYITGFQSFATGNAEIDSWGHGSLYVGYNDRESVLKGLGYYHPEVEKYARVEAHPDAGVKFDGYFIPYLNEAVELCLKAHRLLYNNFIIGWDIVITDEGPLILEANERPGMNAVQCIDGGLRFKIREYYNNTVNYIKERTY